MVWGLVLKAAAKAAAKKGAKAAASKGAKAAGKAARARKAGDDAYNARRRFTRSAERYLKRAGETTGETATRYRELARQNFEQAVSTYSDETKQKMSSSIKNLAKEFGVDIENQRGEWITKKTSTQRDKIIQKSYTQLEGTLSPEIGPDIRSEFEAKALLSDKSIGKRIMGGLVEIWEDAETLVERQAKIFEYFNANSWSEVIEQIEKKLGDSLYQSEDSEQWYRSVKLELQKMVRNNTLVA